MKVRFKSYNDRINYADNYGINKKIAAVLGDRVFEIPGTTFNREILVGDIRINGVIISRLSRMTICGDDLTTTAFLKHELNYLEIVDENEPEPVQTTELLKSVRIVLDGEYNKSELIELRDKLDRLIEEF